MSTLIMEIQLLVCLKKKSYGLVKRKTKWKFRMSNIKNQLQKKIKKERGIMFKNKGNFYVL